VVATVILVATGAGAFIVIPAIACALMMGAMVWMAVRASGHRGS
jgi:hypothetical protein